MRIVGLVNSYGLIGGLWSSSTFAGMLCLADWLLAVTEGCLVCKDDWSGI